MDNLKQLFYGIGILVAIFIVYAMGYSHGIKNVVAHKVSTVLDKTVQVADDLREFKERASNVRKNIDEIQDKFIADIKSIFRFKGQNGKNYIMLEVQEAPHEETTSGAPGVDSEP